MLWKCCTQYASKFGKLSSGHRTGKRSVFIPMPKKGNAKEGSNYRTITLISHASKVMLKILWVRLQQYVNHELPDVQAGCRKGRGTRVQIANIGSVHFISVAQFCPTLCDPMNCSTPGLSKSITNSRSSLKLMSIESVMPSSHLILSSPSFPVPYLSPIPPNIRVFSNESTLHMRWPKYRSFSFSIIPSKEHPGLISFRID